ncbi:hypothetical protein STRTUCAR8_01359 [Streptomyces turgidiscabies Car8]|uniref:Uncharacterized protein n=1 Tax=Streptomyces turgidiscabies (strain Car8) TaxID=698760 RepID=L7F4J9_STRT8|nr:hypothetical protein STRTUCAR8_01359 [Streptomyces turgidiscabies Car8]
MLSGAGSGAQQCRGHVRLSGQGRDRRVRCVPPGTKPGGKRRARSARPPRTRNRGVVRHRSRTDPPRE